MPHHRRLFVRQTSDKGSGVGGLQSGHDSSLICPKIAEFDVLQDRELKEFGFLKDDGELTPKPMDVEGLDVFAVEKYRSAVDR